MSHPSQYYSLKCDGNIIIAIISTVEIRCTDDIFSNVCSKSFIKAGDICPKNFVNICFDVTKKNYGAEGAEVIVDNCQVNLYGGFAPASQTAVELSKALGSRTVMSGSISRGKNDPSQSLQMIERPLMTPDELKSMPKGSFIVAKTGVHPMKVKLRLFLDWGIRFGEPYEVLEKAQRAVAYADKQELEESIIRRHYGTVAEEERPQDVPAAVGGMNHGMQAEKNSRKTILRP